MILSVSLNESVFPKIIENRRIDLYFFPFFDSLIFTAQVIVLRHLIRIRNDIIKIWRH